MSKIADAFFGGVSSLFCLLIWGAIAYGLVAAWNSDWNVRDLFGNSIKKEVWITAERGDASYSTVLDKEWASSTFSHIEAKIKLRDTVLQSDKNDSLDLACEVKAKLTHPVLSSKNAGKEIDYKICLTFKFIDEDGFIIQSLNTEWFSPSFFHEEYTKTNLVHDWDDQETENALIRVLLNNKVHQNVAKRMKRVIYSPKITVTRLYDPSKRKVDSGKWELIEEPENDSPFEKFWKELCEEQESNPSNLKELKAIKQ